MKLIKAKKFALPEQPYPVESRINLKTLTAYQNPDNESCSFYFLISDLSHAIGFTGTNNPSILEAFGEDKIIRGNGKNARFVHQSNVVHGLTDFVATNDTPLKTTKKWRINRNARAFITWFTTQINVETANKLPNTDETISLIEERIEYWDTLINLVPSSR